MSSESPPTPQANPQAGHEMQAAIAGPVNAADIYFDPTGMARAREQLRIETGAMTTRAVIFDQLEATTADEDEGYAWDVQGWYGGDIHRFWWKSEGEGLFDGDIEQAELQFLYSRAITPLFDVQVGVRQAYASEADRTDLVVGLQGLAPGLFEVDVAGFVSTEGDITARAEAEYDLRLTQRFILQPRAEIALAAQDIPEFAIGAGVSNVQIGARLRYEIRREFAPYIGVEWTSAAGETRDFVMARGGDPETTRLVLGVRAWF